MDSHGKRGRVIKGGDLMGGRRKTEKVQRYFVMRQRDATNWIKLYIYTDFT